MVLSLTWLEIPPTIFRSKRSYLIVTTKTKQHTTDPTIVIFMFMLSFTFVILGGFRQWKQIRAGFFFYCFYIVWGLIRIEWLGSPKLYCWSSLFQIYFYHVLFCVCLRLVSCVANVFNVYGLSILSWPLGFLKLFFLNISMINGQTCLIDTILSFPCTTLYVTCVYYPWSSYGVPTNPRPWESSIQSLRIFHSCLVARRDALHPC